MGTTSNYQVVESEAAQVNPYASENSGAVKVSQGTASNLFELKIFATEPLPSTATSFDPADLEELTTLAPGDGWGTDLGSIYATHFGAGPVQGQHIGFKVMQLTEAGYTVVESESFIEVGA